MEQKNLSKQIKSIILDYNADELIRTLKIRCLFFEVLDNMLFELEQKAAKRKLDKSSYKSAITGGMNEMLYYLREKIERIKNE